MRLRPSLPGPRSKYFRLMLARVLDGLRKRARTLPLIPRICSRTSCPAFSASRTTSRSAILRPYLYHPDRLVREYAMYGLTYWPQQQAAEKIWEWVRAQGPSSATVDFLLHVPDFAKTHGPELADISIPYLQSNSPVLVNGALRALSGDRVAAGFASERGPTDAHRRRYDSRRRQHHPSGSREYQ